MRVVILDTADQVADFGADLLLAQIRQKRNSVLGLSTGSTPRALYGRLVTAYREQRVSFANITTFNLDEYLGLSPDHPQSYHYYMQQALFEHIDIDPARTHVPDGACQDVDLACKDYEARIQMAGGIDIQLLGIGRNGHIGFNEPSSSLSSRTRVKTLAAETIRDNARFFDDDEFQPSLSLTMGIGTIMDAKKVVMIATGDSKAEAVKLMVEGPVSASCPASILQMHPQVIAAVDGAAAALLDNAEFYRHVEDENNRLRQARESDTS